MSSHASLLISIFVLPPSLPPTHRYKSDFLCCFRILNKNIVPYPVLIKHLAHLISLELVDLLVLDIVQ